MATTPTRDGAAKHCRRANLRSGMLRDLCSVGLGVVMIWVVVGFAGGCCRLRFGYAG